MVGLLFFWLVCGVTLLGWVFDCLHLFGFACLLRWLGYLFSYFVGGFATAWVLCLMQVFWVVVDLVWCLLLLFVLIL